MKLSVATNWDESLLRGLAGHPIAEYYGSMPSTPIGGGRPSAILPNVSPERVAFWVAEGHRVGIQFNYVLNSTCLGLRIDNEHEVREMLDHVQWLVDIGVDGVTIANPFVLELVRRNFPRLHIKVSVFLDVDGVAKAAQFVDLGASSIVLSVSQNRNFAFLRAARRSLKCGLSLLVNQGCLQGCPYMTHHGNTNAHASTAGEQLGNAWYMHCLVRCSMEKLGSSERLIQTCWIRPEDLEAYEEIGFDTFKIAGREKPTAWLTRAVEAYAQRSHPGNLLDIVNGVSIFEGRPPSRGVPPLVPPELDNRALDGFLSHFRDGHCRHECSNCTYCRRLAGLAANARASENEKLLELVGYMAAGTMTL